MNATAPEISADALGFDMLDTATFSAGHPFEKYDRLRAVGPVVRHPGSATQPPFWLATEYATIQKVSKDAENFTTSRGFRIHTDRRASMDPKIAQVLSRFMLAMDEPEHSAYRGVVSASFMPGALRGIEDRIRATIEAMVERITPGSEVEFVTEVGAIVPIKTVCAIMGVPPEDEPKVLEFTNAVFGTDDPAFAPTLEVANRNYLNIFDYGRWLFEQRRREPKEDVVTLLVNARINGEPLDETDLLSYFSNMISAGNETTRSSLSGAIWALDLYRDARESLLADPSRLAAAVDEILRWFTPVYHMARTARRDVEVGGVTLREGERLALLYGAGNHDPAVFADPHRLDISRGNASRNITFGYGVHHCLGWRLGTMQLRLILEALLRKFPRYELLSQPHYVASNFVRAMKTMHVRLQ
ncbi:MAG: cytochrome P450 [Steroidobacteraceae bacterium]